MALTDEQSKIFDVKYSIPQIGTLSPVEISRTVKATLFKISVITGWPLPEQQEVRNILYDQLEKKLKEDYSDLNSDEIEFATRAYGTTIKDWGKNINLSMLDEILIPYKSKRLELSKIEESQVMRNVPELTPEAIEANYDELIDTVKDVFYKTGLMGLIPVPVYDILIERKEIELFDEEKLEIRKKVEARLENEALTEGMNAIRDFKLLRQNKRDYEIKVRNECKRQAVANYFTKQKLMDDF